MTRPLLILAILLPLSACRLDSTIVSECPRLFQYTPQFWRNLERELDVIAATSPSVMTLLRDYELTQDAIKVCIKRQRLA